MDTKNKNFKFGFTLIELVIVITILAILGSIAFINFKGYTKNSRDSNRLTTLKNIETALYSYQAKTGKYPDPDNSIQIQSSGGTIIGYQGYFGDSDSRLVKISGTPKDPLDNSNYVYSINLKKNKFQIMGFLEENPSFSLANQAYADNLNRTPKTRGNNIGIILDSSNNPIIANIDIENYSGSILKVYLSDNYKLEGTGSTIKTIISSFKDGKNPWTFYDKNCSLADVVIGNQVWAGCNSTLGRGMERGQTPNNIGTNSYSGSPGSCYKSYNLGTNNTADCNFGSVEMLSNSNPKAWFSGINSRGDAEYSTIWGKFYDWDNLNSNCKGGNFTGTIINANCPCPNGWHIPSNNDFTILENSLFGSTCRTGNGTQCNGLGWKRNGSILANNMAEKLKIPLTGVTTIYNNTFYDRGRTTYFWTNTTLNDKVYYRQVDWDSTTVNGDLENYKDYGFNVRCIKD